MYHLLKWKIFSRWLNSYVSFSVPSRKRYFLSKTKFTLNENVSNALYLNAFHKIKKNKKCNFMN